MNVCLCLLRQQGDREEKDIKITESRPRPADTPGAVAKMAKDAMVGSWINFMLLVVK
jgi:hypothetical protein